MPKHISMSGLEVVGSANTSFPERAVLPPSALAPGGFNWREPNYQLVLQQRANALRKLRREPDLLPGLKQYYKTFPAQFIMDWGVTVDPRNLEIGRPAVIPFVMFPRQVLWIDFVIKNWQDREGGITDKSRDMGVTWLAICLACTLCLFYEGMAIGFGSRKEEYVDKLGDPKSIFWKGREFLKHLPREFLGGWNVSTDAPHMRIMFPGTNAVITGESGDNIGRGDRKAIYFVDEAQSLDAKVLTPSGWTRMGSLEVGSIVLGPDGSRRTVTRINDCGEQDLYRVAFVDGTSTTASPNHLWQLGMAYGNAPMRLMRTHEMLDRVRYQSPGGQVQYHYRVPLCLPVEFADDGEGPLPVHPYVVGAMLGDGAYSGSGTPLPCSVDSGLAAHFGGPLPESAALSGQMSNGKACRLHNLVSGRKGPGQRNKMRLLLIEAGLNACTGPFKSVPQRYRAAHPDDRLALLQGLMDTGGGCSANGSAGFYSSSKQLADDVAFLVRSLGGIACQSARLGHRRHLPQNMVRVTMPIGMNPFRLTGKAERYASRKRAGLSRAIASIELIGKGAARCITVSAADGLYVTDDFIVTHNSAHLERPLLVDAALAATANSREDISTPKGMGNPFAQKRHSGKIRTFTLHWRDDPRKDDTWYAAQKRRIDNPVIEAQELDLDYAAAVEGVLVPSAWVEAAIGWDKRLGIELKGPRASALDIADQGRDANAWAMTRGVKLEELEKWSGKGSDILATVHRAIMLCAEHDCPTLTYDGDGMGAGVKGDARRINEDRRAARLSTIRIDEFRGSASVADPKREDMKGRLNEDMYANLKAQGWWRLRMRFQATYRAVVEGEDIDPDTMICLADDLLLLNDLRVELSQPTWSLNGAGKIVVDKAPDGSKSPNLADVVMIRYARAPRGMHVVAQAARRFAGVPGARSRGLMQQAPTPVDSSAPRVVAPDLPPSRPAGVLGARRPGGLTVNPAALMRFKR